MATYLVYPTASIGSTPNETLMKESVEDLITNLFPLHLDLHNEFGSMGMSNVEHNYPMDTHGLITRTAAQFATANPPTAFQQPEGSTATSGTAGYPVKLKGIAEIHQRSFAVSGTDRAVSHYGINDRYTYEALKVLQTVSNDFEFSFWWSPGSVVGGFDADSTGTTLAVRQTQGLCHWIAMSGLQRTKIGTTSITDGNGNVITGSYSTWAQDANGVNLDRAMFENAMFQWKQLGGQPMGCTVYASSPVRSLFTTFALTAGGPINERQVAADAKKITDVIDIYETQHGMHYLKGSFYLDIAGQTQSIAQSAGSTTVAWNETLLAIQPRYYKIGVLRPTTTVPIAKTGDFDQGMVVGEKALLCTHPQGGVGIFNCVS